MTSQLTFQYPEEFEKFLVNIQEEKLRNFVKDVIEGVLNGRKLGSIIKKYGKVLDKRYYYDEEFKQKQYLIDMGKYIVYVYYGEDKYTELFDLSIEISKYFEVRDLVEFNTVMRKNRGYLVYKVEFNNDDWYITLEK